MSLRILCISPLFAPAASAEGFCGNKMVEALQDRGACVNVVVRDNIFHGMGADNSRIWDAVRGLAVNVPHPADSKRLHSIAAALRFQTPIYARWIAGVWKQVECLHRDHPFDVIYSRSMPMAAHVAGFWCAKKLQRPWIANLNDPWSFSLYRKSGLFQSSGLKARNLLFWLRRTLRHADLVTYPCARLHRFHARLAKFDHDAKMIPHIGRTSTRANSPMPPSHRQFRLVHAGMLGASDKTGRSADALLHALRAFISASPQAAAQTKLVLVGPIDAQTQRQIRDLGLENHVEIVGPVNYETSLYHIASASVCVLLEAVMDEGIFLPSKLADYVVAGKPVLAISPAVGTVADLASSGNLLRVDHDAEAIRSAIAALYADFERGALDRRAPTTRLIQEFQPSTVADRFLSACRSVLLQHAHCMRGDLRQNPAGARTQMRPPKHVPQSDV